MRFATYKDKALIESICNAPEIRMWTAFENAPACDADKYLASPSMVAVEEGVGCFLAKFIGYQKYVIHTNLYPSLSGKDKLRATKEALEMAFIRTGCVELQTMVPKNNMHANWFTNSVGFRKLFTRRKVWPQGGFMHDMDFYSMTIDDWIGHGECIDEGQAFHRFLERRGHLSHDDDILHDAYVGATIKMMENGLIKKGEAIYNTWARFAGYEPMMVVSETPLIVDIRECVIRLENGELSIEEENHA